MFVRILTVCLVLASHQLALAQPDPSGIDFVTVRAPGNPAYNGDDPFNLVRGRGAVGSEYRMGRTEVTSEQWLEYFNTFSARPDPLSAGVLGNIPVFWGGQIDPTYQGPGRRYRLSPSLPNAGQLPAYNMDWRTCAKFVNWLNNDKSSDHAAIMNGAYDVLTFSSPTPGTFTDQATHHPDARYWIPTLDEWLKAGH